MKTYQQFINEVKITDKKHIENYSDLSRPLSRILHAHHEAGTTPPRHIEAEGQHFDLDALDRITHKSKLSKKTEVYSGVRHDPMKHVDENNHLHLPAYTSTSDKKSEAKKFAIRQARRNDTGENKADGHLLHIHLEKGHHAVSIAGKSLEKHESERLLPRNTKLKIHPTPETHTEEDGRKIHTWHAHVVSQE